MVPITIHDGMSTVRAQLERDLSRFSLTDILYKIDQSPGLEIWVFDGPNSKSLRRDLYPAYKAQRKPAGVSIYEGIKAVRECMRHTKATQVEVPGYEADDVIATLVKRYAKTGALIDIRTRDYDLRALVTEGAGVTCTVKPKPAVEDRYIQLYKIWVGDPSDNIKGVPGFGERAWEEADKSFLQRLVDGCGDPDIFNAETLEVLPGKSAKSLLEDPAQLNVLAKITGFFDVPLAEINRSMVVGKRDLNALTQSLQQGMMQ